MKNGFRILSKEQIIIETYSGVFSLVSFIQLKRKELLHSEYNSTFDYIIDFSEVYFPDYQKYQDIVYFLELFVDKIKIRKCAIVTNNPNQVVEAVLFTLEAQKILPVSFKIFSNQASAYKWIKYENEINSLQYNPYTSNN